MIRRIQKQMPADGIPTHISISRLVVADSKEKENTRLGVFGTRRSTSPIDYVSTPSITLLPLLIEVCSRCVLWFVMNFVRVNTLTPVTSPDWEHIQSVD